MFALKRVIFLQICNRITALDLCQKLLFAQYLERGWTEFNQILYTHYYWQGLGWYFIFFFIFATELQPLIDIEIGVCSIGQNLTKFRIDIFFDKIYVGKLKRHFSQKFLLNILIINVENLTKFCIHITIDMIYPPSVLQTELCSWTYLCPLIVLWRGYGQILWQF